MGAAMQQSNALLGALQACIDLVMRAMQGAHLSEISLSDAAGQVLIHDPLDIPFKHLQAQCQWPADPAYTAAEFGVSLTCLNAVRLTP